jgi:hypothetical protein
MQVQRCSPLGLLVGQPRCLPARPRLASGHKPVPRHHVVSRCAPAASQELGAQGAAAVPGRISIELCRSPRDLISLSRLLQLAHLLGRAFYRDPGNVFADADDSDESGTGQPWGE